MSPRQQARKPFRQLLKLSVYKECSKTCLMEWERGVGLISQVTICWQGSSAAGDTKVNGSWCLGLSQDGCLNISDYRNWALPYAGWHLFGFWAWLTYLQAKQVIAVIQRRCSELRFLKVKVGVFFFLLQQTNRGFCFFSYSWEG